jgi:hypothetical protein
VYAGRPRALVWTCWLRVVLNQSVRQFWQKVCPQLAKLCRVQHGSDPVAGWARDVHVGRPHGVGAYLTGKGIVQYRHAQLRSGEDV